MERETSSSITPGEIAGRLSYIYEEFTEAVRALGSKARGGRRSGKMAASMAHWVGGSHVTTDREQLCDKFLADVQSQLELLSLALEGASEAEAAEACGIAAEILTEPRPSKSDSTTDLMKRAMIGQVIPFLGYVRREELVRIKERLDQAYTRWQLLPVEKEVKKELDRLIREA